MQAGLSRCCPWSVSLSTCPMFASLVHYYNHLTALCLGLPNVSRNQKKIYPLIREHPQGDTCHLLGLKVQREDNRGRCTNSLAGCSPIWTISASSAIISTIFMLNALPVTMLPMYPGLEKASPSMLACIPSGSVYVCHINVRKD